MKLKESKVTSNKLYGGIIMDLYLDDVRLPDGRAAKREYVRHCGGAAALYIKDGCVALVKQYRYVYGEEIYELPAGKVDKGEQPSHAAARELEEETGYRASGLEKLACIYPSPGYTDEKIHIYLAKEAVFVGEKRDDGEFLDCHFLPLEEVLAMIEGGQICDAKTVCGIYAYLNRTKNS